MDLEELAPRTLRDAALQALAGDLLPSDLDAFWQAWAAAAPLHVRLGLRLGLWSVCLAALPRRFRSLPRADQQALLARLVDHDRWLVRQLVLPLKLAAGFALAWHPDTRARLEPR